MPFSLFFDLKDALSATLHLSRDALHVHIGLIIFLAGAAILRGDRRFEISFLGLLALCLAGEVADVSRAWGEVHGPNWLGSAKDIVSTMFWPAAWLLAWPQALRMLRAGDVAARLRAAGSERPRSVP
jgi:hypothetical protein